MKKIFLVSLMLIMTSLMVGTVYGAISCTFDQTATTVGTESTYLKGATQNLSVTLSGWTNDANSSVAIISAGATGCTISGVLTFNTSENINQSYMNTTVNTLNMKDDTTCTFTMTIKNASAPQSTLTTCTRNFISDNTIPATTLTSPTDLTKDVDGTVTFTYACVNSSSAQVYYDGATGFTNNAMTESSDVCTYNNVNLVTNGFHSWYIIASDGLNTTTSATTKVEVRRPGGLILDEQGVDILTQEPQQNKLKEFVKAIISIPFRILDALFKLLKLKA